MNVLYMMIGISSTAIGVFLMVKYKFYRYKSKDMQFAASLRAFMAAAVLTLFGILILINEIKKIY